MIILETKRMQLREMTEQDVDLLMEIFSDPVTMRYYPSTKTRAEAERWIRWNQRNYKETGAGLWICEHKETGTFLGQCGIVPQRVDEVIESEIGYLFVRKQWGQGFATEAAEAVKQQGFQIMGIKRFISIILTENIPSIKVAERIGMSFEKKHIRKGRDMFIYSIEKT
ncbi:GNAT family N-acetyltransferase [Salsuginibacillus kocurii]|uniref:GNAT family N-acetyltransferase n=1 Tax=Salsuginibacillus kocurii TaxID=427078 RepID=UPI00036412A2|nr:GNAT family N-acetyltransferase [Salsuginibacillus kocurii]